MTLLREFLFPNRCIACQRVHGTGAECLCVKCSLHLEYTHWSMNDENALFEQIFEDIPIHAAAAILWFERGNVTQKLIHAHKYRNQPRVGKLLSAVCYDTVENQNYDYVLAVPSHRSTILHRGYNQAELIAADIAQNIDTELLTGLSKRVKRKNSQTVYKKIEREKNLVNAFETQSHTYLKGKKILLVDDVYTTGATMTSFLKSIEHLEAIMDVLVVARAR